MAENRTKVRQVGDSKDLPIPKNIVADAKEYSIYQGRDGIIVFVPESLNPFRDPNWDKKFTECEQKEAFRGLT